MVWRHRFVGRGSFSLVLLFIILAGCLPRSRGSATQTDWPDYLGDKARTHFSALDQINNGNVRRLQVAWVYHAGDARDDNLSQIQCNPLVVGGVLYGTTPQLKLVALHADTGKQIWRFDPFAG